VFSDGGLCFFGNADGIGAHVSDETDAAFAFDNPNAYRLIYMTRPEEARMGAETAAREVGGNKLPTPAYLAGHSLGEYGALHAAGILSAEETLALVTERGRLMERESATNPGGMQAVVKLDIEQVREIVAAASEQGALAVANHNSAGQIVISGEAAALEAAADLVKQAGGKAIALKVSGAWHSSLIAGAIPDFEAAMAKVNFKAPEIPLYFNVTAASAENPTEIRATLAALLFGFASNLQGVLSVIGSPVPSQFMLMLPYVVTIFAVAGLVGRSRPPAADGVPYRPQ